jgi:hypothetical protein
MAPRSPSRTAALHLAFGLAAAACASGATAQTNLKLPQSGAEVRQFIDAPEDKPCTTCGVVVSVAAESAPAGGGKTRLNLAQNPTLTGGPGGQLATVPLGRKGAEATAETITVITVRYDNGAYTRVEQRGAAAVQKGDRVRITDGRVEPHPR